ncbi:MAG: DUF559 domain-containing protein [Proteobacteria bacterium]|nr:DUF559 domain-containing protein [Pseudomonadota bacterium]
MIERFRLFVDTQKLKILDERDVQKGKQISVTDGVFEIPCTFYNNGNVLVQGKDSTLKKLLMAWAGKQAPDFKAENAFIGYVDLPAGWREWNENADWLQKYISQKGTPSEDRAPNEYKINREIMFHDYMFRNQSGAKITFQTLSFVLSNWFSRFCFMGQDVNHIFEDMVRHTRNSWSEVIDSVDLGQAAEVVSVALFNCCPKKFIKKGDRNWVCPQTRDDQNLCVYNLVDALYPYSSANTVVAYTKTNMGKLLKRDRNLTWYSFSPSSPIEKLMEDGLKSAGLLWLPQYQAHDNHHKYKIDFVIKTAKGPSLAIECDGLEFHAKANAYIKDRIRDRYLQRHGFYVMRFSSVEIFNNLPECLKEVDETFWHIQKGKLTLDGPHRNTYFGVNE